MELSRGISNVTHNVSFLLPYLSQEIRTLLGVGDLFAAKDNLDFYDLNLKPHKFDNLKIRLLLAHRSDISHAC